jgi:hypothetical protein
VNEELWNSSGVGLLLEEAVADRSFLILTFSFFISTD